ncbi:MAG: alkaline phosphatase family protein [Spirochaetales bacterium]|nr:alkaline phosphatase family protein [Spirochaetales bacterium]
MKKLNVLFVMLFFAFFGCDLYEISSAKISELEGSVALVNEEIKLELSLDGKVPDGAEYVWSIGEDSSLTIISSDSSGIVVKSDKAGEYEVSCVISFEQKELKVVSYNVKIVTGELPVLTVVPEASPYTVGDTVSFSLNQTVVADFPYNVDVTVSDADTKPVEVQKSGSTYNFVGSVVGEYLITLNLSNSLSKSSIITSTIEVFDLYKAIITVNQEFCKVGDAISFSAADSTFEDAELSYLWGVKKPSGESELLTGNTSVNFQYTFSEEGEYTLSLYVEDSLGINDSVEKLFFSAYEPDFDFSLLGGKEYYRIGEEVATTSVSNIEHSYDGIDISYIYDNTRVSLTPTGDTSALVSSTLVGDYSIEVELDNGYFSIKKDCNVKFIDKPVANAGSDQVLDEKGISVTLDGSNSTNTNSPLGASLLFKWEILEKPDSSLVELDDLSLESPSFTADVAGLYRFRLTVGDNHYSLDKNISSDEVEVVVNVKKALVIMLDGVRSDVLLYCNTPVMDSMVANTLEGFEDYKTAYSFSSWANNPTNSLPNHTSILTGQTPFTHEVTENDSGDSNNVAYPLIFSIAEDQKSELNTVFAYEWDVDDDIGKNTQTQADYKMRGLASGGKNGDEINRDNIIKMVEGSYADTGFASGTDIDLLVWYYSEPDYAGHTHNFFSTTGPGAGYRTSIEAADADIGAVLASIKKRSTFEYEDWNIIIVADHGGWNKTHGIPDHSCLIVPYISMSKSTVAGGLEFSSSINDVTPSVAQHMGLDVSSLTFDGVARGQEAEQGLYSDSLLAYFDFNGDSVSRLQDKSGNNNNLVIENNNGGLLSFENSTSISGFANYLSLHDGRGGNNSNGAWLSFGNSGDLAFNDDNKSLTITFWYRTIAGTSTVADDVIISNKDWSSGANVGVNISDDDRSSGKKLWMNIGGTGPRQDIEQLAGGSRPAPDRWILVGMVVDYKHKIMYGYVYDGFSIFYSDTGLNTVSPGSQLIRSGLEWTIGADANGKYQLANAMIDDVALWNRALTPAEIQYIHLAGKKGKSLGDIMNTSAGAPLVE